MTSPATAAPDKPNAPPPEPAVHVAQDRNDLLDAMADRAQRQREAAKAATDGMLAAQANGQAAAARIAGEDAAGPAPRVPYEAPENLEAPGAGARAYVLQKREAELKRKGMLPPEDTGEPAPQVMVIPVQPVAPAAPEPTAPQPAAQPVVQPQPTVQPVPQPSSAEQAFEPVELMVNGQRRTITSRDELVRLAQAGSSASEIWNEAKRIVDQARGPGTAAQPAPAAPRAAPDDAELEQARVAYVQATMYDDPQTAAQRLAEYEGLRDRRAGAAIDPDEMVRRVAEAVDQRQAARIANGKIMSAFLEKNGDVMADPTLARQVGETATTMRIENLVQAGFLPDAIGSMTLDQINALYQRNAAAGAVPPVAEVMDRAAQATRDWILDTNAKMTGAPAAPTPQGQPTPSPVRLATSHGHTVQTRRVLVGTPPAPAPEPVAPPTLPTTREAVQEIRRRRGFIT